MARNCYKEFTQLFRFIRTVSRLCGCDFLDKNYKMNILTWLVVIVVLAYFCCTLYTIYIGFVVNGDWKIILQSLSLAGSAIQGLGKLAFGVKKSTSYNLMYIKLDQVYKEYQHDDDFKSYLEYRTDLSKKIVKAILSIYITTCIMLTFYPIFYGYRSEEKILIMSFFLPGVDPSTDSGHMMHNVVHFSLICLGALGNFISDLTIIIFISNIPLLRDIIKMKCQHLNKVVLNEEERRETLPILKEIIVSHQNYNIYSETVRDAYSAIIFIEISTLVMAISFTFFSMVLKSWPAALVYFIYNFALLYAFCGLGHLVELSNDDLINIIYGEILWYELPVREQKLVLVMLRKSQAAESLTIGKVMPLSMSSALQLTKAIYSYMMMLVNFLDE